MEDNIYKSLHTYLKDVVISSPNFEHLYSEEDRALIEFVCELMNSNIHPNRFLGLESKQKFYTLFGIDLSKDEFSAPAPSNQEEQQEDSIKLNHKKILCSSFSLNKNLSQAYSFANPVSQHTCSNEQVSGHVCVIFNRQHHCPHYSPDFQHFATYTLAANTSVYYDVYRHRATDGFTFYTIYDASQNLIHNLSYDANTVYDNSKSDFNKELESIVVQSHSYIDPNPKFNCVYHNQKPESSDKKPKSYIATLVSVS